MKNVLKQKPVLLAGLLCIVITASAWQLKQTHKKDSTAQHNNTGNGDTSKPRLHNNDEDEFRMKDMDTVMAQLNIEMQKLTEQMKEIDFEKINKQVNEAISKIDFEKIHAETEQALKNIDWKQIQADVDKSLKSVDWDKIKLDVDKSLKEAQVEIAKVNTEKIKEQMNELKQQLSSENFKLKFDSEKLKKQIDESLKAAKESIENAKKNLQNLKDFTNALEKDGLIDKKKNYTIELKQGELYINGTKQLKEITEKYRKYYGGKDDFKININGDDDDDKEGESL